MVETTHTAGHWPSIFEPFRTVGSKIADWFAPATEAGSDAESYRIDLELPGVALNDIDIGLQDNVLTVKGEKRSKHETRTGALFFCERQYGAFQRSFRLPPDANADGVAAAFVDGVLTITVPRRKTQERPVSRIPIRSA